MAQDDITEQEEALQERKEQVETEQRALDEGAQIWKDAASAVIQLEKTLAHEMQELGLPKTEEAHMGNMEQGTRSDDSMTKVVEHMDRTIRHLERSLSVAQTRSWNLLTCCIGAELEALYQGREILQNALGLSEAPTSKADSDEPQTPGHDQQRSSDSAKPPSPAQEMRRSPKEEDPESLLLSGQGEESE